jgi:F-type H+-transporting ATPase subunit a
MLIAHAAEEGIAIHLAPPVLGHVFGMPVTSTLVTATVVMLLLTIFAFYWRSRLVLVPGKVQVALEMVVGGAYDYVLDALESEKLARRFFPLIMSIFLFVLSANWLGLLPGVSSVGFYGESHGEETLVPLFYPASTDLNITLGLALVSFLVIELAGIAYLGLRKYGGKFFNFSSSLAFLIGIIELFSELARLISFSFRLFGNIFAGKTLIVVAIFFMPFILPVPLLAFELFVGFIQAFIFAVLTLFFIKLAIQEPQH